MGSINTNYLQSAITTALQGAGLTPNAGGNSLSTSSATSLTLQPDSRQLSPFAQLISTLQQLQQTDPAKYKEVTGQIATNLQSAANTAQSDGYSTKATQLNQLATDFNNASSTGQLPNVKDVAQAVGAHHHHHHAHAHADSDAASSSSTTSSSASQPLSSSSQSLSSSSQSVSSSSQSLDQMLSAFQSSSTQNNSLNPMSIIMNTLSNAGIGSNG